jgi:hypothetical protein
MTIALHSSTTGPPNKTRERLHEFWGMELLLFPCENSFSTLNVQEIWECLVLY